MGCDGANSTVRTLLDVPMTELGFFYDWLIVDVVLHDDRVFDPTNVQICDPARPTTVVSGGPGRRRWEFMRLDHETLDELESRAWELLEPWDVRPDNATVERRAVYTFAARFAERWRCGRVLLAGDAAHQMPPFAGQGMCAGIRDAANLAWKLDHVLTGAAPDALLDTYDQERLPSARHAIEFSIELGKIICVPDPEAAAARDEAMAPLVGPEPTNRSAASWHRGRRDRLPAHPTPDRCSCKAPPTAGASMTSTAPAGDSSPSTPNRIELDPDDAAAGSPPSAAASSPCPRDDPVYGRWFSEHDATAALQRPDFHLYGTAASPGRDSRAHRTPANPAGNPADTTRSPPVKLANLDGRAALVLGDEIADIATASDGRFGPDPMGLYDEWDAFRDFAATVTTGTGPLIEAELRNPVPRPRQVFAIGLNYRSHAEESGMAPPEVPAVFTKFPASLAGPFDDIAVVGDTVDWEVELVVVIGRTADRVAEARRLDPRRRRHHRPRHQRPAPPVRRRRPVLPRQVPPRLRPHRALGRHTRRAEQPRRPRPRLLGQRREDAGRPHQRPHLRRPPAHRRALRRPAAAARATSSSPAPPPASASPANHPASCSPATPSRPGSKASAPSATASSPGADHEHPARSPPNRSPRRPTATCSPPSGASSSTPTAPASSAHHAADDGPAMSIVYYVPTDTDELLVSTMRDRSKAKAVARNPKVSLCVLDERWPFSYLQVYCDATVDHDPDLVVDVMMAVGGRMSGEPLGDDARPFVAAMADQEDRVVLRCRPYTTFAQPPRHLHSNDQTEPITHWVSASMPWDAPDPT